MNDPAITTAIIAASIALFVALLGNIVTVGREVLAHRLMRQREVEKYYNEVYQKLFAPFISDVFLYIDMIGIPIENPGMEYIIPVKDRAIDNIKKHLVYASPKLISSFHNISSQAVSDESGINPSRSEIGFLYKFVQEYAEVIKKTSIYFDVREKEIPEITYRLINYLLHFHQTGLDGYTWKFDKDAYTEENHIKIKRLLENYQKSGMRIYRNDWSKRGEIEKRHENTPEPDRSESINQLMTVQNQRFQAISRATRDTLITEILRIMIRDTNERKEVQEWLAESEQYN